MSDIALITSLYRSDDHLTRYLQRLQRTLAAVDLAIEVVIVCNDATPVERRLLDEAVEQQPTLRVLYVGQETLYASWNRGITASEAPVIGFWNVDDDRTAAGLQMGYALLNEGAALVDSAFEVDNQGHMTQHPANYRPESLNPRDTVGPFFLFARELYVRAGAFDEHFKICGDYEWASRPAVRAARYVASDTIAGRFVLHGDNLSGGTNPLEWVEFNIGLLWRGGYGHLRPVDPDVLRAYWDEWGRDGSPREIPAPVADWLWGADAAERYADYQQYRASVWQARWQTWRGRLGLTSPPATRYRPPIITNKPD